MKSPEKGVTGISGTQNGLLPGKKGGRNGTCFRNEQVDGLVIPGRMGLGCVIPALPAHGQQQDEQKEEICG